MIKPACLDRSRFPRCLALLHLIVLLLLGSIVATIGSRLWAQDEQETDEDVVYFKTTPIPYRGKIIDYTGDEITIRLKNGATRSFPSDRVLRYETTHPPSWGAAQEHYEAHEYILAATDFRNAYDEEPRAWARREILARLVWCFRLQGKLVDAGEAFLALYASDANTPFFSAIPLEWVGGEITPDLRQKAQHWMAQDPSPVAGLIGASHLLAGSDRTRSLERLGELTKHSDRRMAMLAAAQIWRTRVGSVDVSGLLEWEEMISRLPSSLRAGPYYVLGKGYALRRKPARAALSFLWLPTVYHEDPLLAAQACLEAADALAANDQMPEAQMLYREVLVKYGFTTAAREARLQLQGLMTPQAPSRSGAS